MFEFFFLIVLVALLGAPLALSITALVKVGNLRREMEALKSKTAADTPQPAPSRPAPVPVPAPQPTPAQPVAPCKPAVEAAAPLPPPLPAVAPAPAYRSEPKPARLAEVTLGGKVASFAGIGLLLIGVALLVGYAIRHAWMGPGARIVLGLLGGGVLVVLGHLAETRGAGRLRLLARALTGGGTAIFYFCVFAAYAVYGLIGVVPAGIGLLVSAAATLALAIAYRSQTVALIGVTGAFLMPALIGTGSPDRAFLLAYIAVINVPVIALGVYRRWQLLYNTAFGFTALYVLWLLADVRPAVDGLLLTFTFIYFVQFAVLGLFKLRAERPATARSADIVRLLLNSLGLLGVVYVIMQRIGMAQWTGSAMIGLALVHIGLVRLGWKWFPSFTYDLLALLVGALTFASLALPVQLDGAWVSTGWSIEGAVLCWFALRARIPLLKSAALLLGLIGLMKAMLFDVQFYQTAPTLFLNARFASGVIAALLLGLQGWLHQRMDPVPDATGAAAGPAPVWNGSAAALLPALAAVAVALVFIADIFWTLTANEPWAWLFSSFVLVAVGSACALLGRSQTLLAVTALGLLVILPFKLALDVWAIASIGRPTGMLLFANGLFIGLAFTAVWLYWMSHVLFRTEPFRSRWAGSLLPVTLNIGALAAGILLVTAEIYRMRSGWSQPLVTLWWAGSAISLVGAGLWRRTRAHRYAGLALFTLATGKVLLLDLGELDGLERIAAFMGVGVLLLFLSYIYQRTAARLQAEAGGKG